MSCFRLANPEGEGQEVGGESEDSEGGRVKNRPVGRQAEGDVAKLEDLIEREGKGEEGRPKQG